MAAQSPRPDLHRNRPFTKRLLGLLELQGRARCNRATARAHTFAPAKGFEPLSSRATTGRLAVRPHWDTCAERATSPRTLVPSFQTTARKRAHVSVCRDQQSRPVKFQTSSEELGSGPRIRT